MMLEADTGFGNILISIFYEYTTYKFWDISQVPAVSWFVDVLWSLKCDLLASMYYWS